MQMKEIMQHMMKKHLLLKIKSKRNHLNKLKNRYYIKYKQKKNIILMKKRNSMEIAKAPIRKMKTLNECAKVVFETLENIF